MTHCIICNTQMISTIADWHLQCTMCGYESASLQPAINNSHVHAKMNEEQRVTALYALRRRNFLQILTTLEKLDPPTPQRKNLLDIGAAHGWFIELARERYDALGIEPDEIIAQKAQSNGLPIRTGFFPNAIQAEESFHAIAFNDVIEHIPDIRGALEACFTHLEKDGLLVLNLPSSSGIFYRVAKLFARLGAPQFFERMWQLGMPSPHVHYFNKKNIALLLQSHKFLLVNASDLESISSDGLLERIRYAKNLPPILSYPIYWIIFLCQPLLRIFISDIMLMIFKPKAK